VSDVTERVTDTGNSVTQKTLDEFGATLGLSGEQLKTRWAWLLALCLSVIVMALQIGLGTLSDGALAERQKDDSDITGSPEKKGQGLSLVR